MTVNYFNERTDVFIIGNCEIASCGNFMFPNVASQASVARYLLNVSVANGNFTVLSWKDPQYRKGGVQTGLLRFFVFTVKAQCFIANCRILTMSQIDTETTTLN